jgi:hypothetical protein
MAQLKGRGNFVLLTNKSGGTVEKGAVVIINSGTAQSYTTTSTEADQRALGIVFADTANDATGLVQVGGVVEDALILNAVAIGDWLEPSTTAKKLKSTGTASGATTNPPQGACAIALEALAATGVADIVWLGTQTSGSAAAPTDYPYTGFGTNGTLSAEVDLYTLYLQNEIKAWPPLVGTTDFDLVTQNHWWDDEGTPTTKATVVDAAGEASLDEKFENVIKCITDSANEGFKQTYTYADEPRVKLGKVVSALVWVATTAGGTGITAKLVNSDATSTTGASVATDGDWTLLAIVGHTLAGTSCDLKVTLDAASGTFYAYPVSMNLGAKPLLLPPRKEIYRQRDAAQLVNFSLAADSGGFIDADATALTGNLATRAELNCVLFEGGAGTHALRIRRNGSAEGDSQNNQVAEVNDANSELSYNRFFMILDDAGIFEYDLNVSTGSIDGGTIGVVGWMEWE